MALLIYWIYTGDRNAKESKKEQAAKVEQLKKSHCEIKWSDLNKSEKEKALNEFLEYDSDLSKGFPPYAIEDRLLRESTKYPGTIKKSSEYVKGEIKDIEKGIIEYQQPFTAENKLSMIVKGHYWFTIQYNAECKGFKVLDFKVE